MEYLLLDTHCRFLGTMNSDRALKVGDVFQNDHAQTYAIVGTDYSLRQGRQQALRVVALQASAARPEA
jgi:hypothetical protein